MVALLTAGAAVGGALSGAHPTGTAVVDPVLAAVFAALVTLGAAHASRRSRLVLAALALGASRGLILLPAVAALGVAFTQVFYRRFYRRVAALVGALASQVLLRWPHLGFTGLTALLAAAGLLVVAVDALAGLDRRARRLWLLGAGAVVVVGLVLALPAVAGALLARSSVTSGIAATRGALNTVTNGHAPDATGQLRAAAADFRSGAHDVGAWWTEGAQVIPVLAEQRHALVEATASARDVTATAAADAGHLDYSKLHYAGGRIDLGQVRATAAPLATLDSELTVAQHRLASLTSPWLVSPITSKLHSLGGQLDKAHASVDLASRVVKVAPSILGGEGGRRYFVAFISPAENRGLGGYISAYGILTADNGAISLESSGPAAALVNSGFNNPIPGSPKITGPADFLRRYGRYLGQSNFGDLAYAPDLPTVNDVISQVTPQIGLGHIDGALAIDPAGLADLLKITGPVAIPGLGTPLSAANADSFLLKDQYLTLQTTVGAAVRHDYLQNALAAAFPKLAGGSLPGPRQLASDLGPAAHDGDIQFWSSHPSDQSLLESLHLDGAFPKAAGEDLLAVTTTNSGNSKIDAYLHRSIDDKVTYDPATGAVRDHVTITLRNDAPASGLPAYVIGNSRGQPSGTAIVDLAVYSPLGITEDPAYPTDIRPGPVADLGVTAYDAFVDVPAKSTTTVSMTLVGHVTPGDHYALHLRRQVSATPDTYTVEIRPASGYTATKLPPTAVPADEITTLRAAFATNR